MHKLMLAYLLGGYVCMGGLMLSVGADEIVVGEAQYDRYSLGMVDPNDLATMLAVGIPMAWHLAALGINAVRTWTCRLYIPAAVIAVLLTGSRGGLAAATAALLIVPLSLRRLRFATKLAAVLVVCLIPLGTVHFVPDSALERF